MHLGWKRKHVQDFHVESKHENRVLRNGRRINMLYTVLNRGRHYKLFSQLLATVTGWYRTKRPEHCDHFLIYSAPHLSSNHS
jgi:hypothetical protein